MNIIEALKKNEKPFGLMSVGMQAEARAIGVGEFNFYTGQNSGGWDEDTDDIFRHYRTYRLHPNYTEEPEVVKCVVRCTDGLKLYYLKELASAPLAFAPNDPDFIGFECEGALWGCLYKHKKTGIPYPGIKLSKLDEYEILTPTHVLFRGKK